jgi:error-prone DNA polymerase
MSYAELHAISNFTFLRGASHPDELVRRAHELGYAALALTDECSLAGIVRAHTAARAVGLRLIVGAEFALCDGPRFVALVRDRAGYTALCRLITRGRRQAPKGEYRLARADVAASGVGGLELLWLPGAEPGAADGRWLQALGAPLALAVELLATGGDRERLARLRALADHLGLPAVAAGDVHMHCRERRPLQDVLTAIRLRTTVAAAGYALHPNAERSLRPLPRLARLYPPELLAASTAIAARCTFSLEELRYEYPDELVPDGETPASWLASLVEQGARQRWPEGVPERVATLISHELGLIAELGYEPYFLTVHDIVAFARGRGILCQGRGSAANSAVCYCLGVTEVDPARMSLLFERFMSRERNEPPDIDIDFEHERREEVIQYVYGKYGRHRAALAATVISYRGRSAIRDVARALGLDSLEIDRLARTQQWWDGEVLDAAQIREAGLDPDSPVLRRCVALVREIKGFPRHLSQHVGGFVIARRSLEELVPVENAAMPERTVIQWDKDDLDDLGLLKVDLLALGMLTAISRTLRLASDFYGRPCTIAAIPAEDPAVYAMVSRADTVGVFQIESRAQMSMLPRLRPQSFYDLVIEVAIIRPGPIQGGMVHPYLRRRNGEEPVMYPSEEVRGVLERTLGVPIFQEQVMSLAVVAAGFTPGEADSLRRAMAAWKRRGGLGHFESRLIEGMRARGYDEPFARAIFNQMMGFGEYGFPESHAASFALLVYVSAWLKCHEPAAFTAALLNSQPMGFYAPAQLVRDAREHGVEVRGVDATASAVDCTLARGADGRPALRLGLRLVRGLAREAAERLVASRAERPFASVGDLSRRAGLGARERSLLAAAGALARLAGHRHLAQWQVAGIEAPLPIEGAAGGSDGTEDGQPLLPAPTEGANLVADYRSLGLTLGRHPLALLRPRLARAGLVTAAELAGLEAGSRVRSCGLVLVRQLPGSAGGVTFVTLEDETGIVNLIVWRQVAARWRRPLLRARLLEAEGELQRQGEVRHLIVHRLVDRSAQLSTLAIRARDFR